jgi:osmotically-inducible protein OsmY
MKPLTIGLISTLIIGGAATVRPDTKDTWLTTKAKIVLLTTDGIHATGVDVGTIDGKMTLRGTVGSTTERTKAEETIRLFDGVKDVDNQLKVATPGDKKKMPAIKDSDVKDRVEASLKSAKTMDDIKVASVTEGVVLLSGKTQSLNQKLLAIERAYTVNGVQHVSSQIESVEN